MKCQVCQNDLPAGSTFCTNCGTPVPSNPYGSSPSSPNQGIAPTMLASSSTPPDPYAPQPAAPYTPSSNPYGTPSTDYGASTPPANPYGAGAPSPYGTPPASPYGTPPASPYGTPSSPGYNPTPGGFGAPGVPYGQQPYMPQPKKRMNGCVLAIIIVASIFVLVVGGLFTAGLIVAHNASQTFNSTLSSINATATADMGTANADLTPATGNNGTTPSTSNGVPSASQIDATAQANITGAQTSSSVDSGYKPTNVTSNFTASDTIYITYTLSGKAGYTMEKTYSSDGTEVAKTSTPYTIHSGDTNGYFSLTGGTSGSYTTGVYWCQQSDCSDAALAQVVNFTIS